MTDSGDLADIEKRMHERLERDPVVVVSTFEKWYRTALIGLLLIDLALTGVMLMFYNSLNNEQDRARALDCRQLVMNGAVLDKEGSCYAEDVLRYYDPLTGESR